MRCRGYYCTLPPQMKIYTKILIGMIVGAALGLALGPKSELLPHDFYRVDQASQVTLLVDQGDPDTALALPPQASLQLHIGELIEGEVKNGRGEQETHPIFARVRFEFTKQMRLFDKTGALSESLGEPRVGDEVEAWLKIEHRLLESGEVLVFPQPESALGHEIIYWIAPVGDLFMRLIKMVIVPLVFASLLVGVASLGDVRKLGRLGSRTLLLYLLTTACAVSIGLFAAHLWQPGSFVNEKDREALVAQFEGQAGDKVDAAAAAPSAMDNILAIVPENPVDSMAGGNMLQIIFFAFVLGIALTLLKEERSRQVITFFDTVQHAMILIIHMVMKVAPFGVAALIAEVVGQSGLSILSALLVYALAVITGLAALAFFVYGGLVRAVARMPFLGFLKAARPAQLIAFSTSSSSATLPISMECAEENMGISRAVTSFVVPLGATVNMDGTALYQGVAAVFIAQVFGIDLSLGEQVGVVLTATAASIGAAGVPGAGMITLAMVLTAAGIPPVGVALILGVDRILDMFRTAVNVTGDLAVTAVMATAEGEKLRLLSPGDDARDASRGFEGRLDREEHRIEPEGEAE